MWLAFNSLCAQTKLVPLSEQSWTAGPRMAKNRCSSLIKLEVSMDSINSTWIALMVRQINITAQRLLCADPPLVFRVVTCHGPNTSSLTYVNGGDGVNHLVGRSAIFCIWSFPRNFRHLMQWYTTLLMTRFPLIIQ